jgi:hypothetical protein
MIKKLDLNALEQPTLELTLLDADKTTFRLMCPDVKLVERFMVASRELSAVQTSGDAKAIKKLYALTAEIISCNQDGIDVTAEELRDKYGVKFVHLIFIFKDYLDFIKEINEAKN